MGNDVNVRNYILWVMRLMCLGEGPIGQISLNLNYKVNFKDF